LKTAVHVAEAIEHRGSAAEQDRDQVDGQFID
jgi:hypothetical protein